MSTLVIAGAPRKAKIRLGPIIERYVGIAILALGFAWVVWNAVSDPVGFKDSLITGINNGAMYALIALGYTMVYGIIELINFAHGDLFMLATVLAANLAVNVLGVGKLDVVNGSAPKNWPQIVWGGPIVGNLYLYQLILVIGVTAVLLVIMTYIVARTKRGKAMRAVGKDQDGARLMGINVNATISFTFAMGGALAGAAGVLYFLVRTNTYYDTGTQLGLIAFTAAVLGGIGQLTGAVVGAVLIGIIQALNEGGAHGLGQEWSQTVVFLILIILMVFKPEGMFGRR